MGVEGGAYDYQRRLWSKQAFESELAQHALSHRLSTDSLFQSLLHSGLPHSEQLRDYFRQQLARRLMDKSVG